jgi:hypothetical protein
MALCGLLFPVDAALKDWVKKYAFLSQFSFALYGLSAVAVAVAAANHANRYSHAGAGRDAVRLGDLALSHFAAAVSTGSPAWPDCTDSRLLNALPPAWHGLASQPGLCWRCWLYAVGLVPAPALSRCNA